VVAPTPDVVGVDPGSVLEDKLGKVDGLDFDVASAEVRDTSVVSHR
jgi:hypothetical protein